MVTGAKKAENSFTHSDSLPTHSLPHSLDVHSRKPDSGIPCRSHPQHTPPRARHGFKTRRISHRIHYSPRNARMSGSNLKPYTRRTSAHRPPSSMRLRPRLWPFVFAPQSAQVPPCPVSVQCAVACAPPAVALFRHQLAHEMCRAWSKSRPHLPRRRRTLMPHVPLHSTAPPSASPPSHAVCRCARLRLLLLMLLHKMLIPAEPRMWQNQSRPDGQVERRFKAAFDSGRSCRPCDDSQTKISEATKTTCLTKPSAETPNGRERTRRSSTHRRQARLLLHVRMGR